MGATLPVLSHAAHRAGGPVHPARRALRREHRRRPGRCAPDRLRPHRRPGHPAHVPGGRGDESARGRRRLGPQSRGRAREGKCNGACHRYICRHGSFCDGGHLGDGGVRICRPGVGDRVVPGAGAVPASHLVCLHHDARHGLGRHRPRQRGGGPPPAADARLEPGARLHPGRDQHRGAAIAGRPRRDVCRRVAHVGPRPGRRRRHPAPGAAHGLRLPRGAGPVDPRRHGHGGPAARGPSLLRQRARRHRRRGGQRLRPPAAARQPSRPHRPRRALSGEQPGDAAAGPPPARRRRAGAALRWRRHPRARSVRRGPGAPARQGRTRSSGARKGCRRRSASTPTRSAAG